MEYISFVCGSIFTVVSLLVILKMYKWKEGKKDRLINIESKISDIRDSNYSSYLEVIVQTETVSLLSKRVKEVEQQMKNLEMIVFHSRSKVAPNV